RHLLYPAYHTHRPLLLRTFGNAEHFSGTHRPRGSATPLQAGAARAGIDLLAGKVLTGNLFRALGLLLGKGTGNPGKIDIINAGIIRHAMATAIIGARPGIIVTGHTRALGRERRRLARQERVALLTLRQYLQAAATNQALEFDTLRESRMQRRQAEADINRPG